MASLKSVAPLAGVGGVGAGPLAAPCPDGISMLISTSLLVMGVAVAVVSIVSSMGRVRLLGRSEWGYQGKGVALPRLRFLRSVCVLVSPIRVDATQNSPVDAMYNPRPPNEAPPFGSRLSYAWWRPCSLSRYYSLVL